MASIARRAIAGLWLGGCAAATLAQSNWREVAVPMFSLADVARGEALALAARAARFEQASRGLTVALAAHCAASLPGQAAAGGASSLVNARSRWADAAAAWDALSALSTGPLVERRSARQIDFMPARPALLARAVAAAPKTAADLALVGAPARGFPALELLLWPTPAAASAASPDQAALTLRPGTGACAYAVLLGADIQHEAVALGTAARAGAAQDIDSEAALATLVDTVNQWVGGAELLRWAWLRKPLDVAATRDAAPEFPRQGSGQTAAGWAERWQTLRDTAVLGARPRPAPGRAAVPFETLLRGRGLNPLADRLVEATARTDLAMRGLQPGDVQRVRAAAQSIGELTALVQEALAPALGVRLGFSDADGD